MESENCQETAVRTQAETRRSLVLSSRVLVQRACNHSAVETYRYDADGKLTGAEADITTWEERNTEIYGWLNADAPPFEPGRPPQPVNRFRRYAIEAAPPADGKTDDPTSVADYEALLDKMTSQVRAVTPIRSTTISSEERHPPTTTKDRPDATTVRSNETRIDGSKRSHSEHCVTYKSSVQPSNHVATDDQKLTAACNRKTTAKGPVAQQKGRNVWAPPAATTSAVKKPPGFVRPSPVGSRPPTDFGTSFQLNGVVATRTQHQSGVVPSLMSLAERQRKRCMENRARKASGKQLCGVNHQPHHQQQQQMSNQRQWRHVQCAKDY